MNEDQPVTTTITTETPTPPETPAPPRRWLVIQTTAVLESVATQNAVCYGAPGPFGTVQPPTDPGQLKPMLTVRDAGSQVRLRCSDLVLKRVEDAPHRMVWSGYDQTQHTQVLWVWDFYRIQSHVALRAALPPGEAAVDESWQAALDALRAMQPGDSLALDVISACGDIHQRHTLARPAVEWEP
jgi:hypothetical protein